jgi:fatty acid-binding protein DegV
MKPIGILTDISATFRVPSFPGRHLVSILSLDAINHPKQMRGRIRQVLNYLLHQYQHLLILSHAYTLSPMAGLYRDVIQCDHLAARVTLIDSGSFSIGLGLLVEHAARHALEPDAAPQHIAQHLRASSRRTFTLLAVESFDLLVHRDRLRPSQAILAEMLQFVPIYTLEQGELALFDKARNQRTFLQACESFLEEFAEIAHIGLVYTSQHPPASLLTIRKLVHEIAPQSHVHTHHLPAIPPSIPDNLQSLIVVEPPS